MVNRVGFILKWQKIVLKIIYKNSDASLRSLRSSEEVKHQFSKTTKCLRALLYSVLFKQQFFQNTDRVSVTPHVEYIVSNCIGVETYV